MAPTGPDSPHRPRTEDAEQFRALFENSSDAVLLATPHGEVLAANPEACRVFGRSEEEICTLGRPGLVDATDPRVHALVKDPERTGLFKGELRFRRKDGSRFTGDVSSSLYRDGSGAMRASIIIRDVSIRLQAEQRAAARLAVTAAIAESATLAQAAPQVLRALLAGLEGSSAVMRLTGGQGPVTCFEQRTGPALDDGEGLFLSAPIRCGGDDLGVIELRAGNASAATAEGAELLTSVGGQVGQFLARVRSEQKLRESNQFLQEIIDGAAEGIIVIDHDLRYVIFNRFMEQLHGKRAEDVVGRYTPDVFPFVRESGIDALVRRALTGEVVTAPDRLLRKPVGRDVWESIRVAPHRDAHGDIIGAIALVSDVTDRKEAEEALRRASGEIEALNKQLEAENLYLRGDLIANVSHDLRTPVTTLHLYLETLLIKGSSLTEEDRRDYLEIAVRQSQQLARLISELFDLVKLDMEQYEAHLEPIQLAELVSDVLQDFRLSAERKAIALQLKVEPNVPPVLADVGLIERALVNLVENALKHTPVGGRIALHLSSAPQAVRLDVADTGPGIPPEETAQIFTRFYRVDKSRSSKTGGAGLGLAIVKRILDLHGALVSVASAAGGGAVFSVTMPVHREPQEHA